MDKMSVRGRNRLKSGLRDLCKYISLLSDIEILEIGSYVGESALIFSECVNIKQIHCVDPWENGYDSNDLSSYKFPMNLVEEKFDRAIFGIDKIIKHKMSSECASGLFSDNSLDMVYIDGNHTYSAVKFDISLWRSKIRIGGFLCGHDYNARNFPEVCRAVNESLGVPDKLFSDSSWLFHIK